MKTHKETLSGVFVPVVTPFTDDAPDLTLLRSNLEKLDRTNISGYFALGSNGEARTLTEKERGEVMEVFASVREESRRTDTADDTVIDKTVMVGVMCEATKPALEEVRRIGSFGFDYASILPPHYFGKRITSTVLQDFFTALADESSIPLCIYNAPGFANGVDCSPSVIAELSRHDNIAGMKDSSKPGPARFLARLDRPNGDDAIADSEDVDFAVMAGSAGFFYSSLHLGAVGGVLSLANALPEKCALLYSLYKRGEYEMAKKLNSRLVRLNAGVSGSFGVAGVKAAMDAAGFQGGSPRHPLVPLSGEELEKLRRSIREEMEISL